MDLGVCEWAWIQAGELYFGREAGQSSRGVDLFACQSLGQGPRAILWERSWREHQVLVGYHIGYEIAAT